jgi:SAM-dependent methyltransferase
MARRGLFGRKREPFILHDDWSSVDQLVAGRRWDDGLLRLDLGCGYVKPDGFVGLDDLSGAHAQIPDAENPPDVFIDLNREPYPFADDSCDEIRASHFLEHSNVNHVFDEVHRLLRPGGTFLVVVPYANSAEGMFPGHNIFFTERFFALNLQFQRQFEMVQIEYDPSDVWDQVPPAMKEQLPYDVARQVMFNVCNQMRFWATPRKGDRA